MLEESSTPGAYVHIADLVHPQSRQKGTDLAGDRPGHIPGPGAHGTGSSAHDSRTTPAEHEHDRFAREVATTLNEGIAAGRCAGLKLVASNPFLGHLKKHLTAQSSKVILSSLAADYTALNDRDLARRLTPPSA